MYQLIEMTEFFYVRSYGDDSEEVVQALCLRLGEYSIDSLVKVNAMLSNLSKCELTADGLNRKRLILVGALPILPFIAKGLFVIQQ